MSLFRRIYDFLIPILFFVCIGIFVALVIYNIGPRDKKNSPPVFPVFQKGMTYANWSKEGYLTFASDDSLKELSKTNTEWVALIVTWYQDKYNSTQIKPIYKTPTDDSLRHAIRKIHALGMKVMLKPHLDVIKTGSGKWRGDIGFNNPQDWRNWFDSYKKFILHYLEIANSENVELFCVGTELSSSTLAHPEKWRQMILYIKGMYKGHLTYAANWYEEYSEIKFWDLLDYAGVDPYFPLIEKEEPTLRELKEAWKPWVGALEKWHSQINKPIIFTEIGYKSAEGAADSPWEHIPRGKLNLEIQANCYQALIETFSPKKWFWGGYWWYWKASIASKPRPNRNFTPQGKPAQDVLTKWYGKFKSNKSFWKRLADNNN